MAEVGVPINCMSANESYTSLAIGSRAGQILTCSIEGADAQAKQLLNLSGSNFVAVGALAPGTDFAVV